MYRDAPDAPPQVRIVCRPVLRTFLVLLVFATLVIWEGVRFGGPRFHVTCQSGVAGAVDCVLREREPFGSSRYPVHDVRSARVGLLPGQDRGTTFELISRDRDDVPMVARTNDRAGAERTATKVREFALAFDPAGAPPVDEGFGPTPALLVLALAFVALGVVAAVRALRRVEFVITRGEVRATSVGRGAPQVSRAVPVDIGAAARLRGDGNSRVLEIVTTDGAAHVLADVGWLSESRAHALCARVEDAVARAHTL